MHEITWPEAIEIAKQRAWLDALGPLSVVFNGAKGDFASLQSTGIVGAVTPDDDGRWFVDTGTTHNYLHAGETVWVWVVP